MDLPSDVEAFLDEHVGSIEELEVILLLQREHDRAWHAASVAAELRISAISASDRLQRLVRVGLAVASPEGVRHAAGPAEQTIARLALAYEERRHTVIRRIFEKPNERVRTFADAFRIRRDK